MIFLTDIDCEAALFKSAGFELTAFKCLKAAPAGALY